MRFDDRVQLAVTLQALNASFERYEEERRLQGVRERDAMLNNTAA